MNKKVKAIVQALLGILAIAGISFLFKELIMKGLTPYIENQKSEGNLTFLFVASLMLMGFFNHIFYAIGNSKTVKFSYVSYKYIDIMIPIWSTVKFIKYYKDFTNHLINDNETSKFTKIVLSTLPILMLINTLLFWIILIGGYIGLSLTVGLFDFTEIHSLYTIVILLLYFNSISLRSFMYLGVIKGMESALYVFKIKTALIFSLLLPLVYTINIILIVLGVFGVINIVSIPILNISFILLPTIQPIITAVQLFTASNEAELTLIGQEG